MSRLRHAALASIVSLLVAFDAKAERPPIEVAGQTVITVVSTPSVKGGGAGAAVEGAVPIGMLAARLRFAMLGGLGLAWTVEAGAALRTRRGVWEPDAGVYALYMGGDLVRAIDREGYVARSPIALTLGVQPLRFVLDEGFLSFLSLRAGPVLGESGIVSAVSLGLFELGRRF